VNWITAQTGKRPAFSLGNYSVRAVHGAVKIVEPLS